MLKFNEENKQDNLLKVKGLLEALPSKIEALLSMEVGLDFMQSDRSFDLVLTTKFNDKDGLSTYATDPAHLDVVNVIKEVTQGAKVVDYIM
jgi:hypothetical protein